MMQHIETIELASSQTSISIDSIPQDYDDLVFFINARSSENANFTAGSFSVGANVNRTLIQLLGDGSNASTTGGSFFRPFINGSNATLNTYGNTEIYISNYSKTNTGKSLSIQSVTENNNASAVQIISSGLWDNNDSITTLTLSVGANNLLAGSTFSLYGITAGGDGTVTTS